jgi:hypothetical protein
MQTKGGGKHDILPVGRATATTLDCLWMMPRDPDTDMCPAVQTTAVSTEDCMAHQSCRLSGARCQPIERWRSASRAFADWCMIKQRRRSWSGSKQTSAQLGRQDKSRKLRRGRVREELRCIKHLTRGASEPHSLSICATRCAFTTTRTSRAPAP